MWFIHKLVLSDNILKHIIDVSDVIIFNCGLHYQEWDIVKFAQYIDWMSNTLKKSKKNVIVRNTLPQHFPTKHGFYDTNMKNKMKRSNCTSVNELRSHPSNLFLKIFCRKI